MMISIKMYTGTSIDTLKKHNIEQENYDKHFSERILSDTNELSMS